MIKHVCELLLHRINVLFFRMTKYVYYLAVESFPLIGYIIKRHFLSLTFVYTNYCHIN